MHFPLRLVTAAARWQDWQWPATVAAVALLVLMFKLNIARTTIGTNDMLSWQHFADLAGHERGIDVYHLDPSFNHPPAMIYVLRGMTALSQHTPLSFPFWLRLPAILADLVSLVLVWCLVGPRWPSLLLLAVCPALIMVSGFHGNTDPAMIAFVLLAVYLLERRQGEPNAIRSRPFLAGVAFGLAMCVKVVPIILLPVFICWLPSWKARFAFGAAAATTFCAASLPFLLQDPQIILRQVFGYGSTYGQWGLSRILQLLPKTVFVVTSDQAFFSGGRFILLAVLVSSALGFNFRQPKPALVVQCGLAFFAFLVLSPGFGVQYLAWLMPWAVVLGFYPTLLLYVVSGLFLFQIYSNWSGGFPWHLAISFTWNNRPDLVAAELLCWAVVVWCFGLFFRATLGQQRLPFALLSCLCLAAIIGWVSFLPSFGAVRQNEAQLADVLRQRGVDYAAADDWEAQRLTFAWNEDPVVVPLDRARVLERYRPALDAFDASPTVAIILPQQEQSTGRAYGNATPETYESLLNKAGTPFEHMQIADFVVLLVHKSTPGIRVVPRDGWSKLEDWGMWAKREKSTVSWVASSRRPAHLNLTASPLCVPGRQQRVTITTKGVVLFSHHWTKCEVWRASILIPAELIDKGWNDITFLSDYTAPASTALGAKGNDKRSLAFAVTELRVKTGTGDR